MNLRPTLEGRLIVLEPLDERHRDGLLAAAADPVAWTWMVTSDGAAWVDWALTESDMHHFAVIRDGEVVGSTSYLNVVPEHRRLEIGNTWSAPAASSSFAKPSASSASARSILLSAIRRGLSSSPSP